jgi:hypothetical protein
MLYHQFSGTLRPFLGVAITILCFEKRKTYFGGFVASCYRNATTVITCNYFSTYHHDALWKHVESTKTYERYLSTWSCWSFPMGNPWYPWGIYMEHVSFWGPNPQIPGWKADRLGPIEPLGPIWYLPAMVGNTLLIQTCMWLFLYSVYTT